MLGLPRALSFLCFPPHGAPTSVPLLLFVPPARVSCLPPFCSASPFLYSYVIHRLARKDLHPRVDPARFSTVATIYLRSPLSDHAATLPFHAKISVSAFIRVHSRSSLASYRSPPFYSHSRTFRRPKGINSPSDGPRIARIRASVADRYAERGDDYAVNTRCKRGIRL